MRSHRITRERNDEARITNDACGTDQTARLPADDGMPLPSCHSTRHLRDAYYVVYSRKVGAASSSTRYGEKSRLDLTAFRAKFADAEFTSRRNTRRHHNMN